MYAVIEAGGKQLKVAPGDVVQVETIPGDVGAEVELGRVLAVMNDSNELVTGAAAAGARDKQLASGDLDVTLGPLHGCPSRLPPDED